MPSPPATQCFALIIGNDRNFSLENAERTPLSLVPACRFTPFTPISTRRTRKRRNIRTLSSSFSSSHSFLFPFYR